MTELNQMPFPSASPTNEVESMSWLDIWGYALTKPSVETFEEILKDPKATRSPYLWVGLSTFLAYILTVIIQSIFGAGALSAVTDEITRQVSAAGSLVSLCCAPVVVIFAVLGFALSVGINHLLAKMFNGQGTYSQLAFAMAAFNVPMTVVSSVLAAVPYVNLLTIPIAIYAIILNVIAIKVVHQFGWGKAIAVVMIPVGLLILIGIVVVALTFATLMPLIQQGTQNLNLPTY